MQTPAALEAGDRIAHLLGVRLLDGSVIDLTIDGGRVSTAGIVGTDVDPTALGPTTRAQDDAGVTVDGTGWLVLPALGEPHAHLDKVFTLDRVATRLNGLTEAVAQWYQMVHDIDGPDVRDRATQALEQYAAAGVTAVRSHVDLPVTGDPFRCLHALLELRDRFAGRMTLQVVPLVSPLTTDDVLEAAAAEGVDLLGGCPHLADDPAAETTRLLDVAEKQGLPVDLHTDERLDLDGLDLVDLAQQVLARGMQQRVTASHCVRLSSLPPDRLASTLDLVARAGIGVVTLPQTNLYLQGRDQGPQRVPRGIAPARALLDAGITLAAGGDNLRDPFNAVGSGDPLETASLLVSAAHLFPDEALHAVTVGVRDALGLPPAGPAPGAVADLLLVPSQSVSSVVAGPGAARVVVSGGTVVARTRVDRSLALAPVEETEEVR